MAAAVCDGYGGTPSAHFMIAAPARAEADSAPSYLLRRSSPSLVPQSMQELL
jgi:hypothetical protein